MDQSTRRPLRFPVQAQELLPGRVAPRRRKGSHSPDRPARGQYCRQAVDIHRFCYNLAVRTHRFCRRNRLSWPSWMDISKAFNAGKREDHPFVTQVSAIVATGAFRDFGQAVDNWRNPGLRAREPKVKRPSFTGTGSFLAAGSVKEIRYDGKRRVKLPCLGSVKLGCILPKGHLLRGQHQEGERPLVHLPEALATAGAQTGTGPQTRRHRHRHQPPRHRLRRTGLRESQSLLPGAEETEEMAAGPGPAAEGLPGLVGSPAQDRQVPPAHPGPETRRPAPDDQHGDQEVQRPGN